MKISVIIPTYKPGAYIWECLDSLRNQTLPKEDFELILVLNGCKDPYYSQIQEYIDKNLIGNNVNFIQTDTGGVSNARNIALDVAKGEYITFIDDDDYISASFLEELLSKATRETVAISNTKAFRDGSKEEVAYGLNKYFYIYRNGGDRQKFYKCRKFFSGPVMKLFHRDIIGNRRFDTRFKNGEDNLYMFLISDRLRYVSFSSELAVYHRRYRANSAMLRYRSTSERIRNSVNIINECFSIYLRGGYSVNFFVTRILAEIKSILISILK